MPDGERFTMTPVSQDPSASHAPDSSQPSRAVAPSGLTVAVMGYRVAQRDGVWYTNHSFGRLILELASRVRAVHFHGPQATGEDEATCDCALVADRITVHPWKPHRNSIAAMKHPLRLIRAYRRLVRSGDAILLRGGGPLCWTCHLMARAARKTVVHWLISNPVAALKQQPRGYGRVLQWLGVQYARLDRALTRWGIRVSRAFVLANGSEVARLFPSPRTEPVISTTIRRSEFHERPDTCTGDSIRMLFVGFIRPEKGIEYLIRALPMIRSDRPVRLAIVGPTEAFPAEIRRLRECAGALGLDDRVTWEGYAAFGDALFSQLDRSDVLVLPSLSEGTPRVLVEARARSLPIVATNVGGIPTSVRDGQDGLLVEPRDARAIAGAVTRIIEDGPLRRSLIRTGRQTVADWTIERFVDRLLDRLTRRP